jgi:hypothetical protein
MARDDMLRLASWCRIGGDIDIVVWRRREVTDIGLGQSIEILIDRFALELGVDGS